MSTIYPGRIVEMTEAGPKVMVPALARDATWGPVSTIVAGLQLGDQVAVTNLGDSRDALLILGRMGGIEIGSGGEITIEDVAGLRPELDAIDIRVDALIIDQNTDHGILGEHGDRLDDIDAGQLTQNTRLTATEGVANGAATAAGNALTAANNAASDADDALDAATAAASGVTTLRADTAGKVTTKGDLLAATGAGVLARRSVGTNGQILTAVTSGEATGMAWADSPKGMPLGLTGATALTRYVGATSAPGPPTTGTLFQNGDYALDSIRHIWVRTSGASGAVGTWVSWTKDLDTRTIDLGNQANDLDTRITAQEVSTGRHVWTASNQTLVAETEAPISGWSAQGASAGLATVSGTNFKLNRVGRWSVTFQGLVDHPVNGYFQLRLSWPSGPISPLGYLIQGDHRQSGYNGCGFSRIAVTWSGWVDSTQASSNIQLLAYQANAAVAGARDLDNASGRPWPIYWAMFNYMGGS